MTEGKGAKDFTSIKRIMYNDPATYSALMEKVTAMMVEYLNAQIRAGAQAIQIFDTWGGILSPGDYENHALYGATHKGLDLRNPVIISSRGKSC
jgi:uroporphyrinogen decarboxylase